MPHHDVDIDGDAGVVNEKRTVPVGFALALFSVFVVLVGATWYLGTTQAKIETKLDSALTILSTINGKYETLDRKVNDHEREDMGKWTAIDTRVSVIEKSGSEKTREIERSLNDLKNDFKVHEATTKHPNGP